MKTFLQRFRAFVLGVLCGFDRLRFRGSKRQLCHEAGIMAYLSHRCILLKDFKAFVTIITITWTLSLVFVTAGCKAGFPTPAIWASTVATG